MRRFFACVLCIIIIQGLQARPKQPKKTKTISTDAKIFVNPLCLPPVKHTSGPTQTKASRRGLSNSLKKTAKPLLSCCCMGGSDSDDSDSTVISSTGRIDIKQTQSLSPPYDQPDYQPNYPYGAPPSYAENAQLHGLRSVQAPDQLYKPDEQLPCKVDLTCVQENKAVAIHSTSADTVKVIATCSTKSSIETSVSTPDKPHISLPAPFLQLMQLEKKIRKEKSDRYLCQARETANQAMLLLISDKTAVLDSRMASTVTSIVRHWIESWSESGWLSADESSQLISSMSSSASQNDGALQLPPDSLLISIDQTQDCKQPDVFRDTSYIIALWLICNNQKQVAGYLDLNSFLNHWPSAEWFQIAPETLIPALLNGIAAESPEGLVKSTFLDTVLHDCPEDLRTLVKWLVAASACDSVEQQEHYLQQAVLTGYSHPLPYLQLIENLVAQEKYEDAHHIYEMYRLVVLFNVYWDNPSNDKSGPDYEHACERSRLESLFELSLKKMRKQVYTLGSLCLPTKESLQACVCTYWPDHLKAQAEDMLFLKTFETPWNMRETIIEEYSQAVIQETADRWESTGSLSKMIRHINHYIRHAPSPLSLDRLHAQLASLLLRADAGDKP